MSITTITGLTTPLYIGGREIFTADHLAVTDPANPSAVVGLACSASRDEAVAAVAAAKAAYPAWAALSPQERAARISTAAEAVRAHIDEDARVLSLENGKVLAEAVGDIAVLLSWTDLAVALADQVDARTVLPGPPHTTTVSYQPLGVVTIVVPFNWPLGILGASLPYALMAGNPAIVKPPPTAPLSTMIVVQRMAEQLPPGVLNVVSGANDAVAPLIANPDVGRVVFTGSVRGGATMMKLAADSLARVTLELGGNDPAIVLDDAVLDDQALDRLHQAIYATTGQICVAAKRVYVHRSRYDELVAGLSARLEKVNLGRGIDESTTMGPLNSASQKEFVLELLNEARQAGVEVREFGRLPEDDDLRNGNFLRPSLVLDPDPSLRVVTEEQFGPTTPIIPFDEDTDAVAAANNSWAGLCASVWTADPERADRIGSQLICGHVYINDHRVANLDLRAPFGGMKQSGMGREGGVEGLREYQDTRAIQHITS
jgi:acyl-CoA reductase-like NAD-dependent aldehyde dehydrogenase